MIGIYKITNNKNGKFYIGCPKSGVPFYIVTCDNEDCSATWNFGISNMYEG